MSLRRSTIEVVNGSQLFCFEIITIRYINRLVQYNMLPPPIQFIRHDMSMPLMELDVLLTKFNNTSGQQGLKSILKVSTSHHRYKRRSGLTIHNLLTNRPTHLFTTKTPHLQTFFPVRNSAIAARGTLIYQCTIQFQLVLKPVLIEEL